MKLSRRQVLCLGGVAFPSFAARQSAPATGRLKIMVVGGHPDDPESGCGGTIARYSELGHDVAALYLTRGEAGIAGRSHEEAAAIRTREAEAACKLLGARPVFAGQVDGSTEVTPARYREFAATVAAQSPDIVFAQWPVDTHRDHRSASLLAYDAWLNSGRKFALFYYEVMTGTQTQNFHPTHYVDITATEKKKRDACFAHVSQEPSGFYGQHSKMNEFRGREAGVKYAEAFIRHAQSSDAAFLAVGQSAR